MLPMQATSSRLKKKKKNSPKLKLEDIPGDLVLYCLEFVDVETAVAHAQTCSAFNQLISTRDGNLLWESLLSRRFTGYSMLPRELRPKCFRDEYVTRISAPRIGDCVEVLWEGKFHSHTLGEHGTMRFEGRAWWQACIVGVEMDSESKNLDDTEGKANEPQQYYRAHFMGWEAKWDEWVTRSQIRWPKPLNYNREVEIDIGDKVEVLLEGTQVPSVWMEGEVQKVTIDIDGIELFLVTGMKRPRHLWVRKCNLRLSRKQRPHKEGVPCWPSLFSMACRMQGTEDNRAAAAPRCASM
eukprot:CAMPEP_0114514748 /NCGR_PEP_ID=MMETSP0109-20121206/16329_1 /TAXON_ID=29199 /ORGANISM="Chlorarachnion reptans, Strain CCCM449" /LENGTH=295 /DNA_ID=CAMNT_0001694829 /DNA_START=180 /DNA_END=1067 /DNA_ORIENTATION=+